MAKSNHSTGANKAAAGAMDEDSSGNHKTISNDGDGDDRNGLYGWAWIGVCGCVIARIIHSAYLIRMAAIDEYGPVIHEFDPYFNYRATEVRKEHGGRNEATQSSAFT